MSFIHEWKQRYSPKKSIFYTREKSSAMMVILNTDISCEFRLFDLIPYVPVNNLSGDGSSWVEPVLSKDKCVLLKDTTQ